MRRRIIPLLAAGSFVFITPQPADAVFGVGDVVIDPTNLAQNVMTATRSLEQINNQIEQLQNEADMLINQAKELKSLDFNSIEHLKRILERIDALMREGEDITYEVEEAIRKFKELFPESYAGLSNEDIGVAAERQWQVSRRAFGKSIEVQSAIVTAIAESRDTLENLVEESQSAEGGLSAMQAGNQLMALSIEQQMQTQSLMAAHYRMTAMEEARRLAAEEQGRIRHERFFSGGASYTRGGGE